MAGPIGMAVARGVKVLVCPHCSTRQLRARNLRGPVTCKKCRKTFDASTLPPAAKPKRR